MNHSLFDELHPSIVALGVHKLINGHVDWTIAHHDPAYLDMVKVRYRTFQIEYPKNEAFCNLPSMFAEEFGSELHKYNVLADRFGNRFEAVVEKRRGDLYFTHGWSEIRKCYVDGGFSGGWASLTYIRPKLFVLILKDRYYRDLKVRDGYSNMRFNLSRSLYGPDGFSGCVEKLRLPYHHDYRNFAHCFHVVLTEADILSGSLTMMYKNFASKLFSKDARFLKLVDQGGLEWNCTIQYVPPPHDCVKIGGEWPAFLKARNLGKGSHIMLGTNKLGKVWELFVMKFT